MTRGTTRFSSGDSRAPDSKIPDPNHTISDSPDQTVTEPRIFKCPICGGNAYSSIYIRGADQFGGPLGEPDYCVCETCSVMFGNPQKFMDVK